jgi:F-type H+-transporting ATPase subunit gamma
VAQEREIATRIVSLRDLLEIVSAIRAISASQMQQALRSLDAIRRYSDSIHEALAEAASMIPGESLWLPPAAPRQGLVVFCAEHGLCGAFNELPIRAAQKAIAESKPKPVLIVIGTRGGQICRERELVPDVVLPMATHCGGVTAAARRIAAEVYKVFSEGQLSALDLLYAESAGGPVGTVQRSKVLPLEMPKCAARPMLLPPLINVDPRRLFDDIVGEYFFASLENAAMQSFFTENATRFRTMEAAHQNIDSRAKELEKLARRIRQETVTTEILDLISATEALSPVQK